MAIFNSYVTNYQRVSIIIPATRSNPSIPYVKRTSDVATFHETNQQRGPSDSWNPRTPAS